MARKAKKRTKTKGRRSGLFRWIRRTMLGVILVPLALVVLFAYVRPPTTPYALAEGVRLGGIERRWIPLEGIAPVMVRSVIAAEDANFCRHHGFDMTALRAAIAEGASRGGSTISQQVVKNVYLWQGRSWVRKAMEAALTPAVELVWTKERIVEVYLNVAEFDEGVFGVAAAARHYFGVPPDRLDATQAARLATVLPNPKARNAADLSQRHLRRMAGIRDGAETIRRDGRADCVS